jgi:hypothetical protein
LWRNVPLRLLRTSVTAPFGADSEVVLNARFVPFAVSVRTAGAFAPAATPAIPSGTGGLSQMGRGDDADRAVT